MGKAKAAGIPMIMFNGELDRIRGGYFPAFFYPSLAKVSSASGRAQALGNLRASSIARNPGLDS
jgi:hypothetical protein